MVTSGEPNADRLADPFSPTHSLHLPPADVVTTNPAHQPQPIHDETDSGMSKAEKVERHGTLAIPHVYEDPPPTKRQKIELDQDEPQQNGAVSDPRSDRQRGQAAIKKEFLIDPKSLKQAAVEPDDDAAEAAPHLKQQSDDKGSKKKQRGQNKARTFGKWSESKTLCGSRMSQPEFSPKECRFGDKCKFEHDLRKYLQNKQEDLATFNGICPIWDVYGTCPMGWKCRFAQSHYQEVQRDDGRSELVLVEDEERKKKAEADGITGDELGAVNVISNQSKIDLSRKRFKTPKADQYIQYFNKLSEQGSSGYKSSTNGIEKTEDESKDDAAEVQDNRASYTEPPFLPSEKRRIYYGPETPVLSPLTTTGNLPFRRLCVSLGAQATWSEMAMGMPLLQGEKSEWALAKAHASELLPPTFSPSSDRTNSVVEGYDNSRDSKFGVQIAANKPWLALKTTEILTALCPHLRAIDLNCGCPIDLVYRQGAGSALLDSGGKLEKILRGMNAVSNEVPITAKIRMGTKDAHPNADKLIERLVLGGEEAREEGAGPSGVAAITLHGRSRQQRYTKEANWSYIAECAALINRLEKEADDIADTSKEVDDRDKPNGGKVYFVGNGDCYSQVDYFDHIRDAKVDSVMIARGALIKPWIFEEIATNQYLDKSASERFDYVEKFARFGLEVWGSDEMGISTTRRFLLEWLSFACRYVPLGILEHLPPKINERAPAFKGRNELETLLSSGNYKDWIKIRSVGFVLLFNWVKD